MTDPRSAADWSCFVSHRLAVVNKNEDKTVTKESQNRYSRQAKDWGWREFITLTSLFDQDAGFIVNDTLTFAAEVVVLKETTTVEEVMEISLARFLVKCLCLAALQGDRFVALDLWNINLRR